MPFTTRTLARWADIREHARSGWLYRGHRCIDWKLESSLERYCERQKIEADKRSEVEQLLVREFKRAYHELGAHMPSELAYMEWLSLMQHHGAPTRVIDFTYSVYVAAYFALEKARGDCAVWALNAQWAVEQSATALGVAGKNGADQIGVRWQGSSDEQVFDQIFISTPRVQLACPLNPFLLNDRLRAQRGAFVVPGDVTTSFVANLQALPGHDDSANVVCLVLPAHDRKEALRDLFHMNVTRASLFPGLDGYAQMLSVYHPTVVDPIQWK